MRKYRDKYGDIWEHRDRSDKFVYRISDNCIGGWDNGRGLTPVEYSEEGKTNNK